MSCPNCGASVPASASFCGNCGTALDASCPSCGASTVAEADYCPECGTDLSGSAETDPATAGESGVFRLRDAEFARRVSGNALGGDGFLDWIRQKQTVTVETGNQALLLENGKLKTTLGPGKHTLDSLTRKVADLRQGQDLAVFVVEDGTTTVTVGVSDLRTATDYLVDVAVELVVRVTDPQLFFTEMMSDRDAVTTDTFDRVLGDAIRDELEAVIARHERDDLYGNRELKRDLQQDVEHQLRQTLERNGLGLVELLSFDYADDLDDIRRERKEVAIEDERADVADERLDVAKRNREREVESTVHDKRQEVREKSAKKAADHELESQEKAQEHELESQEIEQDHEREDMQRHHRHEAERENVEHKQEKETTRKEGRVERRDLEHEQDMSEMEGLMDLKKRKDMDGLDVDEREQDIEMRREEHEVEVERERLQARDEVDLDTLASMDGVDEAVAELAEIEKAEDLTPEQLEALGAQDSDELAKARQEAHSADHERQRVEDRDEFREEMREMMDDSMDRMQETTESAMDNMGDAASAAAEDTSDNVIVSDAGGSSDSGDTTIVQGGGQGGGQGSDDRSSDDQRGDDVACPECGTRLPAGQQFCTDCGTQL